MKLSLINKLVKTTTRMALTSKINFYNVVQNSTLQIQL